MLALLKWLGFTVGDLTTVGGLRAGIDRGRKRGDVNAPTILNTSQEGCSDGKLCEVHDRQPYPWHLDSAPRSDLS